MANRPNSPTPEPPEGPDGDPFGTLGIPTSDSADTGPVGPGPAQNSAPPIWGAAPGWNRGGPAGSAASGSGGQPGWGPQPGGNPPQVPPNPGYLPPDQRHTGAFGFPGSTPGNPSASGAPGRPAGPAAPGLPAQQSMGGQAPGPRRNRLLPVVIALGLVTALAVGVVVAFLVARPQTTAADPTTAAPAPPTAAPTPTPEAPSPTSVEPSPSEEPTEGPSQSPGADPTDATPVEPTAPSGEPTGPGEPTVQGRTEAPAPPPGPQQGPAITTFPPGARECTSGGAVGGISRSASANDQTSCAFAESVRQAYGSQGSRSGTVAVRAYSPVTGAYYNMACNHIDNLVACTGGNNAVVYLL